MIEALILMVAFLLVIYCMVAGYGIKECFKSEPSEPWWWSSSRDHNAAIDPGIRYRPNPCHAAAPVSFATILTEFTSAKACNEALPSLANTLSGQFFNVERHKHYVLIRVKTENASSTYDAIVANPSLQRLNRVEIVRPGSIIPSDIRKGANWDGEAWPMEASGKAADGLQRLQ